MWGTEVWLGDRSVGMGGVGDGQVSGQALRHSESRALAVLPECHEK